MSAIEPRGERVRRALRWLSESGRHDAAALDEAARRFDLTPVEAEFLHAEFGDAAGRTGD